MCIRKYEATGNNSYQGCLRWKKTLLFSNEDSKEVRIEGYWLDTQRDLEQNLVFEYFHRMHRHDF